MALVESPQGQFRFLPGIDAYSSGVVAAPGFEIIHATLQAPLPFRDGFALIDRHLRALGRPPTALCAVELRIPAPLSFEGFDDFNRDYRALLAERGILVDGENPVARTNVAPVVRPPAEPSLYAFSYTVPGDPGGRATFVVAGSGELREGHRAAGGIVRRGETSPGALLEKAAFVMGVMQMRLVGLGGDWAGVTAVDVYTPHPIEPFHADALLGLMGPAAAHGVHWYLSWPPIVGLEFEADMRGVRREIRVGR